MINLIPNEEKKRMLRGFYYRAIVVFILGLSFAVFTSVVAISPAYFLSTVKKNLTVDKLEELTKEEVPTIDQATERVIADLNHKLSVVENARLNNFFVSENVINAIILRKLRDIKIYQISYNTQIDSGAEIIIRGMAPSRERLLLFRRALEDSSAFKEVDLPISNFVRGSNIEFSINLKPN